MSIERPDDARSTCANCGTPLAGPFCHACGQKDLGTRVELRELVAEVVSETFEVEGRLPRTLVSVAVRPGQYLREYLAGRRRSFASPLRFYLLMVFVSALAIASAGRGLAEQIGTVRIDDLEVTARGIEEVADASAPFPVLRTGLSVLEDCRADLDSWPWEPVCEQVFPEPLLGTVGGDRSLECGVYTADRTGRIAHTVRTLSEEVGPRGLVTALNQSVLQQVPLVLSLLVAFQALVLKLLWWRHHGTTHVLTSMVFHTLWLVALTLLVLLPSRWVALALFGWHQTHVVFGLRAAYGSGWLRTLAGYAVLVVSWSVAAIGALVLAYLLGLDALSSTFA